MKLLTRDSDYAIRALMFLNRRKGQFISVREIAAAERVPYQFLRRILQQLVKAGLVESREGAGGGIRIKRDAAAIPVSDVIRIFQGEIQITECLFQKQLCHNRDSCVLRHEIMRIEELLRREFDGLTIQTLLDRMETQTIKP